MAAAVDAPKLLGDQESFISKVSRPELNLPYCYRVQRVHTSIC
jgi:hypothetical protein